jgi:hypothetical protein
LLPGSEIFKRDDKHAETFAIVFAKVFMMHLMCPSQCSRVLVVDLSKEPKTLVNKYVMDNKISESVDKDANANRQPQLEQFKTPEQKRSDGQTRIKDKEQIIALEP